jgi:hypothetical protein
LDIKAYLTKQGVSEADQATLIANPAYVKVIEAAIAEGSAAKTAAEQTLQQTQTQRAELEKWWKDTAQPAILEANGGTAQARAEAARYQAYIKSLNDDGYPVPKEWLAASAMPVTPVTPVTPLSTTQPSYDPRKAAYEMANSTARLYDLGEEYRELFGTRMPPVESLLAEAQQANKPLTDYVRTKFSFDTKRQEVAAKAESERIAKITKEIEERTEAKYASRTNPHTAPAVVSKAAAVVEANKDHADSWKTRKGRMEAKKDRLSEFRNRVQ